MKESAGIVLYRESPQGLEVLLVHPSGNYNRHAPWSIPKGVVEGDESIERTARRELREETGIDAGELFPLSYIDYRSGHKRVHAFAGPAPTDAKPRCASWEIDQAEFLPLDQAREKIHPDQRILLDRLQAKLKSTASEGSSGHRSHSQREESDGPQPDQSG